MVASPRRSWISTPDSEAIDGFGYSTSQRILKIKFKHGHVYDYLNVPPKVFTKMRAASSRGAYVAEIKKRYDFVDVTP